MKTKYRISGFSFWAIVGFAALLDGLQFLLTLTIVGSVVAFFIGLLGGIALWLTFTLHGVKYSGSGGLKKIGASFGTMALEMIPFIDALPLITIGAVIVVLQTRKEDVEKQKKQEEEENQKTQKFQQQQADWARAKQAANDNEEDSRLAEAA